MANANTNLVTSNGSTFLLITTDTANTSVLVDYSNVLSKIANSAANSAAAAAAAPDYSSYWDTWGTYWLRLVVATERIADATENIESHQLNIRNDIHHLRILGDHNGSGIRTTTPYGWLTNAYYYKWFIDEGHILDDTCLLYTSPSPRDQA